MTLSSLLSATTRRALLAALRSSSGHRGEAAALLSVSPRTLARLVAQHLSDAALLEEALRGDWPQRGGEGGHHDRSGP